MAYILDLKLLFFRSLFEWMIASRLFSFSKLLDLIDHCNFRVLWVYLWYTPYVLGVHASIYLSNKKMISHTNGILVIKSQKSALFLFRFRSDSDYNSHIKYAILKQSDWVCPNIAILIIIRSSRFWIPIKH